MVIILMCKKAYEEFVAVEVARTRVGNFCIYMGLKLLN